MHIILCDDDTEILVKIEMFCKSICKEGDLVTVFSNPKRLLEYMLERHPEVDLFVLDIEMPELDGLELKRQITSIYMNTNILFLTCHREMMGEAFGKNVLGFLSKEHYEERLGRYIYQLREDLEKEDRITDKIVVETGEEIAVPVKKRTEVRKVYNEYCLKVARIIY